MSRLNNIIKFILLNVNIFFSFIGFFFFGFSLYLWAANWGSLDAKFFYGAASIALLFGFCLILTACMGCQSINNQTRIYVIVSSFLTGRKLTFIHLVMLILGIVGEIYLLMLSLTAVTQYKSVYDDLSANPNSNPSFVIYEAALASKFNDFFFGATSTCKTSLYAWFWTWIDSNCPSSVHQQQCQACYDFSLSFCEADEGLCSAGGDYGNAYCPYTICRAGIAHYFQIRIRPFAYALLVLTFVQIGLIMLDIMVLCYHPRDSYETIQRKRGLLPDVAGHSPQKNYHGKI